MRIETSEGRDHAVLLVGEASVRRAATEIEHLRSTSKQDGDVLTSLDWFLSHSARSRNLPLVVLVGTAGQAEGAVLLHGRRVLGIPTGLFKAGYLCGRGSTIGVEALRSRLVERAARHLLRQPFAHTVMVTLLQSLETGQPGDGPSGGDTGPWRMRETRHTLSLTGGWDAVRARFSAKMRRNLGYYRRRAERDLNCQFLPRLSSEQSQDAVAVLHGLGSYPHQRRHAMRHEAALRQLPGGFAMGLKDGRGQWLGFLAGWRSSQGSFIEWQLNTAELPTSSISIALRNYWLEHEIAIGMPRIVFVGETSPNWSQACELQYCGDALVTRSGHLGTAIQNVTRWVRPSGQVAALQKRAGGSFTGSRISVP